MKVGIVTFHFAVNYGAVLQAYASCAILRVLGHEPLIIDYRPRGALYDHYHRWDRHRFGLNAKNLSKLRLNPKFSSFRKNKLPIDPQVVFTPESLAEHALSFDAILYGSDQIWNPTMFQGAMDVGYWAASIPNTVRKVALSASFGGDLQSIESYRIEINRLAQNFDALSVREKDALNIFDENALSEGIQQLADPVVGLESWEALLEPLQLDTEFVFEFAIQPRQSFKDTSQAISRAMGLQAICSDVRFRQIRHSAKPTVLSVGQWLWSIKNARVVVTNSFHATLFSILFNTPFIFVPLEGKGGQPNPRNNRILDLLRWSGLESRIWNRDLWKHNRNKFIQVEQDAFQQANIAIAEQRCALREYLGKHLA
ncbi:MAG: polysaccharide pyruvyl transferase family protein [Coraliomargaritaceae bacterium]